MLAPARTQSGYKPRFRAENLLADVPGYPGTRVPRVTGTRVGIPTMARGSCCEETVLEKRNYCTRVEEKQTMYKQQTQVQPDPTSGAFGNTQARTNKLLGVNSGYGRNSYSSPADTVVLWMDGRKDGRAQRWTGSCGTSGQRLPTLVGMGRVLEALRLFPANRHMLPIFQVTRVPVCIPPDVTQRAGRRTTGMNMSSVPGYPTRVPGTQKAAPSSNIRFSSLPFYAHDEYGYY
eukprot:3448817-Rhodomonas_salina.2